MFCRTARILALALLALMAPLLATLPPTAASAAEMPSMHTSALQVADNAARTPIRTGWVTPMKKRWDDTPLAFHHTYQRMKGSFRLRTNPGTSMVVLRMRGSFNTAGSELRCSGRRFHFDEYLKEATFTLTLRDLGTGSKQSTVLHIPCDTDSKAKASKQVNWKVLSPPSYGGATLPPVAVFTGVLKLDFVNRGDDSQAFSRKYAAGSGRSARLRVP